MVCNERFVFCSHNKGVVSVHAIASGDLVTEVSSEPADPGRFRCSRVAINKELDLVASLSTSMDGKKMGGTIWSVPQMEVVTHVSFTLPGHAEEDGEGAEDESGEDDDEDNGLDEDCQTTWIEGFHVISATKVVAQVFCLTHGSDTLVVANKTVDKDEWVCHPLLAHCRAYDCEDGYIAAAGTASHINND